MTDRRDESIFVAKRAKKLYHMTVDVSTETRDDLDQLIKLSRACKTKGAVISGVAMRYLAMLKRQLEAEAAGDRLKVYRARADGEPEPLFELDLRL